MAQYQTNVVQVDATQYLSGSDDPKYPGIVLTKMPFSQTGGAALSAPPAHYIIEYGDWVVAAADGTIFACSNDTFSKLFVMSSGSTGSV
jgi:hypothetical protein